MMYNCIIGSYIVTLISICNMAATEFTTDKILPEFVSDKHLLKLPDQSAEEFLIADTTEASKQTSHSGNGKYIKWKNNSSPIYSEELIHPFVISGQFSRQYTVEINETTEYIFEYIYHKSLLKRRALRIKVYCPSSKYTYPLLVVVRQQRGVLSWQLPLEPPPNTFTMEEYKSIARTLCPQNYESSHSHIREIDVTQRLLVDVSTSSHIPLNFSLEVDILDDFIVELMSGRPFKVSPGEPVYYYFRFPDDVDMVLVKATSEDDLCAMVSIQNVSCPVFDTEESVRYGNFYQTMTLKAGITVRKLDYPNGFYIILVTLSNDEECSPRFQHIYLHRIKEVTLLIEEKITYLEYIAAIVAGLGFCAFFYIVALILACIEYIRAKKRALLMEASLRDDSLISSYDDDMAAVHSYESASTLKEEDSIEACAISICSSLDEEDYDVLEDAESEKDVFRMKTVLYVTDLARKDTNVLKYKSFLYIVGLLTVAVFYAVPVVQLVVTYQNVLDETGNQDICYYNFWCAHPLGPLSDFNHIYSNIAYILFGILFIGLCARKERRHRKACDRDRRFDKYYGIPQHFGMFYAMGAALITEGILSACYHICPNYSNFQFDTAFMYVIAVLCMLKIYQTRHPDINASANATYFVLSVTVLLGVIGVLSGTIYFWVVFAFIHVTACFVVSGRIYYMGRWTVNLMIFHRCAAWCRRELLAWRTIFQPLYCDRMILLLMGNVANWGLSIYGVITTPKDFASFLLIIFLTNLLLYTGFYIIMKLRHKETVLLQPLIYIFLCAGAWGAAAYFFLHPSTTWEMTPAHSRQFNRECSLLHFYDAHDIWHFLSSAAIFFSFMLLMTLDDDLTFTPRAKIPVF